MRYALGKKSKFISDRSGFAFPYKERVKEWNGNIVHKSEFEQKHPQLTPRKPPSEPQALYQARPDRTEVAIERLLNKNPFKSGSSGSAVITVTELSHGRSTSDIVRFRNCFPFDGFTVSALENSSGYSITKVSDDKYTFSISSGTATTGSTKGGGSTVTAGPVTVSG